MQVWRPGVDPLAEDEELDYDPTAYDCLHAFSLEWPCLSFDLLRDGLGGPRTTFPHTVYMVAGTQAAQPRQNAVALLRLEALGQGRHGKRDATRRGRTNDGDNDDEDEDDEDDEDDDDEGMDSDADGGDQRSSREPPPRMHHRHACCCCCCAFWTGMHVRYPAETCTYNQFPISCQ
jgi:ribosome assembly protein RRB1